MSCGWNLFFKIIRWEKMLFPSMLNDYIQRENWDVTQRTFGSYLPITLFSANNNYSNFNNHQIKNNILENPQI